MRINKRLSNLGYCSRTEANRWIDAGRLTVNGQPCRTGQWLEETDDVRLDGEPLSAQAPVYLLLNKPVGITCTSAPEVADNIIDFVGYPGYIFPVGRLDKESEGLMLLTNDGELANQVLAAEHGHEKAYLVDVNRPITDDFLAGMAAGVVIDGQMTKPCVLEKLGDHSFQIILSQGLNRQIRKMCRVFHYKVLRLKRIRILNLELGDLAPGQWRHVTPQELETLIKAMSRDHPSPES